MALDDRDYMRERFQTWLAEDGHWPIKRQKSKFSRELKTLVAVSLAAAAAYFVLHEPTPPLALPENGAVTRYQPLPEVSHSAQFSIVAPALNTKTNYAIKLSDWDSNAPALALFLRGGQQASVPMPYGRYRLTITEGSAWYGPERLFGRRTLVSEGIMPIVLRYDAATQQHVGQVVTLSETPHGNFPTRPTGWSAMAPYR
jgi:hypothetical protein